MPECIKIQHLPSKFLFEHLHCAKAKYEELQEVGTVTMLIHQGLHNQNKTDYLSGAKKKNINS